MKDLFAPDMWIVVIAVIICWLLSLAPVLFGTLVALRRNPRLPRRFLFVAVVSGLSYGFTTFFLFFVSLPLGAFTVFIAPQLQTIGQLPTIGLWLTKVSRAISDWGWIVIPLVLAVFSVFLTRYLAARWDDVVTALGPNKSFKPNPLRGSA